MDASPDTALVEIMRQAGGERVQICSQAVKGRQKGAALREAAMLASGLPGVTDHTFLCWQEAEKVEMVGLWKGVFEHETVSRSPLYSDIVVPYRELTSFQKSYPIEQFHSEQYANMYMDCVAKTHGQSMIDKKTLTAASSGLALWALFVSLQSFASVD